MRLRAVWIVTEVRANTAEVVAVKADEGAAMIDARVRANRWPREDQWRVKLSGPHMVEVEYA